MVKPGEEGLTYKQISDARRKEELQHNMNTFGNVAIGIHGKELPKFSEHDDVKKYWEKRDCWKENVSEHSAVRLK